MFLSAHCAGQGDREEIVLVSTSNVKWEQLMGLVVTA